MTTWLPSLVAFVLVVVEARRLVLGHLRREERRALIARAVVVAVGIPGVFAWFVGMDFGFAYTGRTSNCYVVKISYRLGKLWVADV